MRKSILFAAFVAFAALVLSSCGKEPVQPRAIFEYSVDELTVTFTNLSKDADSYLWDFGDGETSTEKDPVHTYAAADSYQVTLTAKNSGAENSFTDVVKIAAAFVKIDGQFDDWDRLVANNEQTLLVVDAPANIDPSRANLTKMMFATDEDFIYYYMEVGPEEEESMCFSIHIDADDNVETGKNRESYWEGMGMEYQFEYGDIEKMNRELPGEEDAPTDAGYPYWHDWTHYRFWCWGDNAPEPTFNDKPQDISTMVARNGKLAFEGRLPRAILTYAPVTNGATVGVKFASKAWAATTGALPARIINDEGSKEVTHGAALKFAE